MARFVKIGIRTKTQTLFSGAEVVSAAEGHRKELSCAHTHIYSYSVVYALTGSNYKVFGVDPSLLGCYPVGL